MLTRGLLGLRRIATRPDFPVDTVKGTTVRGSAVSALEQQETQTQMQAISFALFYDSRIGLTKPDHP